MQVVSVSYSCDLSIEIWPPIDKLYIGTLQDEGIHKETILLKAKDYINMQLCEIHTDNSIKGFCEIQ